MDPQSVAFCNDSFEFEFEFKFPYPLRVNRTEVKEDGCFDGILPNNSGSSCGGPAIKISAGSDRTLMNHTRKHSVVSQDDENPAANKKRKTLGRPKIDWTPSRSRKLVRLYLMTDLTVEEIKRVIRSKGFRPRYLIKTLTVGCGLLLTRCSKRHIQNQLSLLLQSRPNTIRGTKVLTKARLCLLRDCRALRHIQETLPVQYESKSPSLTVDQEENIATVGTFGQLDEWPHTLDQVMDYESFTLVNPENNDVHSLESIWSPSTANSTPKPTWKVVIPRTNPGDTWFLNPRAPPPRPSLRPNFVDVDFPRR